MARPAKEGTSINIKMASDVFELLENYSKEAGMTKTVIIERAVKEYIEKRKNK